MGLGARLSTPASRWHTGQFARAAACLDELVDGGWPRYRLEAALLRARVGLALSRAGHEVNHQIECGLAIAEEHGFVRTVLLEGPEVHDALENKLRREPNGAYRAILAAALRSNVPLPQPIRAGPTPYELSERERDVLRYLATRMSNREIAVELSVSLNTLKTHVKSIYRKLDAASRSEAVGAGRNRGLV